MKKTAMIQILGALAIAAALVMTTASCSSEDNLVANPDQTVQEQGTTITVSANIADDASTRSMVEETKDDNGIKRTLKFTEGDRLYVYGNTTNPRYKLVAGMLTMVENSLTPDGKSAMFSGSLKAYNGSSWTNNPNFGDADPLGGTEATLIHKDMVEGTDYNITFGKQPNQLSLKINSAPDVETLMTKNLRVTGGYNSSTKSFALSSEDVIFNCVFTGLVASTEYYCQLRYPDGTGHMIYGGHDFTTDANGISSHDFCFPDPGGVHPWEIEIKQNTTTIATIDLGTRTLEKKIYNVSRHWNGSAFSKTIDLSTVSHDLVVGSGMTLTGVLGSNVKISIAPGATVTLNSVTINGVNNDAYRWAGLTCLGNAHIVLAEENTVSGFHQDYPGIQPGPAGTTLTISSIEHSDKLIVRSNNHAAGIGCMVEGTCGNITIIGGKVEAEGGWEAAGIGSSYRGTCGNITISGGSVTATGGDYAAGIGSGSEGACGNITINNKNGLTSVTATRGIYASPIGNGSQGANCGDVKIFGKESIPSDDEDLGDGFYFHITNDGAKWTIDKPEH